MNSASNPERSAMASVLAAFAFLAVLFSGVFPPFSNPNELSRFETVVAVVQNGTFAIDGVIPALGDHEDKAVAGGRTYSNKAPGLALAAVPVYGLLRLALPAPVSANADPIFRILRILTVSIVCVAALRRFGRRVALWTPPAAPLVLCGVALGTPYLLYARSFFSHAWTAALLFFAWDLLGPTGQRPGPRSGALVAFAGLLAGWAVVSEYTVAPVAVLLLVRSSAGRAWRRLGLFACGLAAALALLGAYDTICFGRPWVLSSAREAYSGYSKLAATGLFGFGPPRLAIAIAYLVHPARGVLIFSPFLLWCLPGFFRWWRTGARRADFYLALSATVLYVAAMTGYPNWHGGWSLGPRYLLPILFFPASAIGYALSTPRSRSLFAAAVAFSVAGHFALTASFPYFADNVPWPVATGSLWFLSRGWVAPNLLSALEWGGAAALALSAAAFALALGLCASASGELRPRPLFAVLLGLAPLALLLARPPELPFGGRLWRAAVFGAYSGLDRPREELRAVVLSAATPREQRQAAEAWRVAGPPAPREATPR